jgi:DNA-binding transcriptional regulator GbsR (MarR family)
MNKKVLIELFKSEQIDSGIIQKLNISSYTYQETIKNLQWLDIIIESGSKLNVKLLDNQTTNILKKLTFNGFDTSILKKEIIIWFSQLLKPLTLQEITDETHISIAQTMRRIKKFSQFITKEQNKYSLSKANKDFYEFIKLINEKEQNKYFWTNGREKLKKLPIGFAHDGVLTGFSKFSDNGIEIIPTNQFIFFPKKELSLEEILVHAIKFSNNANDITLCILFYLKNKQKLNIQLIENEANKFGVLKIWLDIVSYLEEQVVNNKDLFLPREEFKQKEELYKVQIPQRFEQNKIQNLFDEIEEQIKTQINVYFIGGNALIEHQTKNSTKDIDLVMISNKEASELVSTLKKLGFNEVKHKEFQYGELDTSAMLEKNNYPRVDLFLNTICGMLEFSKGMQKRSKQTRIGKVNIFVASLEDVFLLKSISSRDSDIVDCENILKQTIINWDILMDEIENQKKILTGLKELIILEHFEALEKRMNIKIPIVKKLTDICLEKSILFLAKKPITVNEIKNKIGFSETLIRNKITSMEKQKQIIKTKDKPFKIKLRK